MKRLHLSQILKTLEKNPTQKFHIKYVKLSTGEIKEETNCALSSMHAKGTTINILKDGDKAPRKIRKCLIIEFNKQKIYL